MPIAAFCGIGNPVGFRHTLESLGCQIVAWREFPDHHGYTRADVVDLAAWARTAQPELLVCTRKDLVKLRTQTIGGVPLRAAGIELGFLAGQQALEAAIAPVLQRAAAIPDLGDDE
jgi:tetraacyldisaccharide 4'-kinase